MTAAEEHTESDAMNSSTSTPPNGPKSSNTEKQEQPKAQDDPPRDIKGWRWAVASSAMLFSIFL